MKDRKFWLWFGLAAFSVVGGLAVMVWALSSIIGLVRGFNQGIADTVKQASDQAFGPVGDLTTGMATQVSELLNPTPTLLPDPVTVLREVRTMTRLETIQFTMEKVIVAEQGQGALGALFGDRLLFVAHGQVIAGIDLAKLESDDLWVADGVLYARLPQAEVFVAALDNEKSYVFDRETGLLTKGDVNLETAARQAAEEEIKKAAVSDGILYLAQQNAERYLDRLLRDLGYPEVIFVEPELDAAQTQTPAP